MNLLLLYYSGAGNTQLVATYLMRQLRRMGHSVTTKFARKGITLPSISEFYGLVVGSPVYAYQPPNTLLEVVGQLPELNSMPVYTFMTKGLISGNAPLTLANAIESKGGVVIGHSEILMADTLFLLTSHRGSLWEWFMLQANMLAVRQIKRLPHKVIEAFERKSRYRFRKKLYVPLTNIIAREFHRFVEEKSRLFFADEKCDLCSACVGLCPNSNIRIVDGRVIFGEDCDFCVRCVHRCPQEAIQIGRYIAKAPRYMPQRDKYLRELMK